VPTLQALGKDFLFLKKKIFAECPLSGARQSLDFFKKKNLCRVPSGRHSAKFEFFFKKNSLPSVMVTALGKAGKM